MKVLGIRMSLARRLREFLPSVYERYGPLNARQYAYRSEVKGLVTKKQFDYVNSILTKLREDGILPWKAVLDSSREFRPWLVKLIEDTDELIRSQVDYFRSYPERFNLPLWQYQPVVPIIFTEKEGLIQYFEMIADNKAVSIYAQKGQIGKSHFHEVVFPWLMKLIAKEGKKLKLLYLGDCDDEGFQIPLTLLSTLSDWAGGSPEFDIKDLYPRHREEIVHKGSSILFKRLALKPEQVESLGLPTYPINPKSPIARKFVDYKAELEALDPDLLRDLITQAIDESWDEEAEMKRKERAEELRMPIKERISELTKDWGF